MGGNLANKETMVNYERKNIIIISGVPQELVLTLVLFFIFINRLGPKSKI